MTPETKREYVSQASNFIREHLSDYQLSVDHIIEALLKQSVNYTIPSWRKLRRAMAVYLEVENRFDWAKRVTSLPHPNKSSPNKLNKKKQPRKNAVSNEEHLMLRTLCKSKHDLSLLAAIELAWLLGCRPCEMLNIELLPENRIKIISGKKSDQLKRGLDRTLILSPSQFLTVSKCTRFLEREKHKGGNAKHIIKRIQRRLENATKKLWPEQKFRITLYSYRHQLGSDYKGDSAGSRPELAALMGHQSVDSANTYGDRRNAKGRSQIKVDKASVDAVRKKVLKQAYYEQHKEPVDNQNNQPVPEHEVINGYTVFRV